MRNFLGIGIAAWVDLVPGPAGPLRRHERDATRRPPGPGGPTVAGRLTGDDRATRLADVALTWNVIQHFYPYFDVVEVDWPGELRAALTSAATDRDEVAFLTTLRRLVAAYHDGHGNVRLPGDPAKVPLPIAREWAEGKLVVTADGPGSRGDGPDGEVRRGDVGRSIDNRPAAEALGDAERLISAATLQWARWNALRGVALGPPGSSTALEVERGDGRAISYAESCPGIVEHEHLGAIVGGPTAGTNGNINVDALPGGDSMVFTGMMVLKHDGSRHHGVGILPTVPVSRTVKGIAEGRDELLEKAIEVVGGGEPGPGG